MRNGDNPMSLFSVAAGNVQSNLLYELPQGIRDQHLGLCVKFDHKAFFYIGELIINPKILAWKITPELLIGSSLAKMRLNTL